MSITVCMSYRSTERIFFSISWLMLFDIQQTTSKNWHNGILTHTYRTRQTVRERKTGTAKISALAYESCSCVSVCVRVVYAGTECVVIFHSGLNIAVHESHWTKGDVPQDSSKAGPFAHTHTHISTPPLQHLLDKRAFVEDRHSSATQAYVQLFWHQDHVIHSFVSRGGTGCK